ncbi:hypothetical protein NSPZN2_130081 [Nitrospira defluvii]|uniref:Uncharacterized protein n=1 Tax=Nitrospira defluvii TaxID=330214 RepID=A0ABM8R9K2_9BACT|nr:hypothetical protein NSPZN2_130081 [Nitrospira defluvii]
MGVCRMRVVRRALPRVLGSLGEGGSITLTYQRPDRSKRSLCWSTTDLPGAAESSSTLW